MRRRRRRGPRSRSRARAGAAIARHGGGRAGGRGRRDLKGSDPEVNRPPIRTHTPPRSRRQATPPRARPARRRGVGAWRWFEFGASFPGGRM